MPEAGRIELACGIGNPDADYAKTRHNAGKWLLDLLAQSAEEQFKPLRDFAALTAGTKQSMWLAKTTCHMNQSGTPVGQLLRYLQVAPANLLIVHDELDLAPGLARFKFGGGLAGHNGLSDIVKLLGTRDFWRLRIGIGKPDTVDAPDADGFKQQDTTSWVLGAPDVKQQQMIDATLTKLVADWHHVQAGRMDTMMRHTHVG